MTTDSVIAASAGILAGACFGFFYQRLTKCMAPQTKSHDDGNNSKGEHELYQTMLGKVGPERDAILERMNHILNQPGSGTPGLLILDEFSALALALNQYPRFLAGLERNDPDYVTRIHGDTLKHHQTVTQMAKAFFSRIDEMADDQYKPAVRSL